MEDKPVHLVDMVDNPREDIGIEMKRWVDLTDNAVKSSIARHLAALCNHGGGYLIFGFCDDLTVDKDKPASLDNYNHDTFNGIIERYITPNFECYVNTEKSTAGDEFVIVRVAGHGALPVCAKRDGPQDNRKSPQGIKTGTHYIRTPGPKSTPVTSPEQWRPLIRRCVLSERDALLSQISGLFRGNEASPTNEQRLVSWDELVSRRIKELIAEGVGSTWQTPLLDAHYQLSYMLTHDDQPKTITEMRQLLSQMNLEVRDTVSYGRSMFYPFTRPEDEPRICSELPDGVGNDILEVNKLECQGNRHSLSEFWRLAPDGRASIVRAYNEDIHIEGPEKFLSPKSLIRELTEFARHARAFARHFPTATTVAFQCTWLGLQGRRVQEYNPAISYYSEQTATQNRRVTSGEWSVARLNDNWEDIVAHLGCPVLSQFGIHSCSAKMVKGMAEDFVRM